MSADPGQIEVDPRNTASKSAPIITLDPEQARVHARQIVANSGSSFAAGMKVLPKARREGMYAVYAFCREVDDIADEGGSAQEKIAGLRAWREELDRLYAGNPTFPTAFALQGPIKEFGLPKEEFLLVIDGMEMDARGPIIGPPFEELMAYCRRVAGAVGLLSIRVFGATPDEKATDFALALADALQLTNILRDVGEDAAMGRVYLPSELLDKHGVSTREPTEVLVHPALGAVCEELGALAHEKFGIARTAIAGADLSVMRPALLMMGVYERTLQRLEERGWADAAKPIRLSKLEKATTALRWALWPPV